MADSTDFYYGTFPKGFAWSTATASYQIEGAWDKDGKGVNIWDTFSHEEGNVLNGDTGDVACDSYHKYAEDIQLMKNMGTTQYRFSISWSRIFPDGTKSAVNQAGIDYYNRVIDGLIAANIVPMITLYHWDLPQPLHEIGGWPNPELAELFNDYARVCFQSFGDRVKYWLTFNEPICTVWLGYGSGVHAPGIKDPTVSTYKAAHTIIRAHAKAWQTYNKEFRKVQGGQVGITLNTDWHEPKDPSSSSDQEASERAMQCKFGWYANPIFGDTGDYPEMMKAMVERVGKSLGQDTTLPEFTAEEKALNKGSYDFFGLNYYTTRLVSLTDKPPPKNGPMSENEFLGIKDEVDPKWTRGASDWLYVYPPGLRKLLQWIKKTYNNPPVYITENGISDSTGELDDQQRIDYYRGHINEVLKALSLDGCDVRGYTAWSLLDNFEWAMGYSERFGMHHIDYNDPERKRTPKASAKFYAKVIKDNGFPKPAGV